MVDETKKVEEVSEKYEWDTYCYVECEEDEDACEGCERRLGIPPGFCPP